MAVSINTRIKEVRKALGLSQRAFCNGIFISQSFYAHIESGTRQPNERIYELIATKYNVNKEWILTGKGGNVFRAGPGCGTGTPTLPSPT